MLIRALAAVSAAGLLLALWSVRRALADRRREEARWAALDDRTERWP